MFWVPKITQSKKNNEKLTCEKLTTYHIATRESESRARISAGGRDLLLNCLSSGSPQQQQQWLDSFI